MAKKDKNKDENQESDNFEKIKEKPDKWQKRKKFKNKKKYLEDLEDKRWN